jgi:hypothetical protein
MSLAVILFSRKGGKGGGDFLNAEGAKVTRRAQKRNTKKYQNSIPN